MLPAGFLKLEIMYCYVVTVVTLHLINRKIFLDLLHLVIGNNKKQYSVK